MTVFRQVEILKVLFIYAIEVPVFHGQRPLRGTEIEFPCERGVGGLQCPVRRDIPSVHHCYLLNIQQNACNTVVLMKVRDKLTEYTDTGSLCPWESISAST